MTDDTFDHYWNLGRTQRGPWVGFDEKDEECADMSFAEFHNVLRILRSIDFYEVSDFMTRENWDDFRRNPANYFLTADDEEQALLWGVIEMRSKRAA